MWDNRLYILSGVTAVGKTELSLQWAERYNAVILSCDSTLFYQGMDVGTAKPTTDEQARVSHYGIDLVPVTEEYDISAYIEYAQGVIEEAKYANKRVLVVGGSGFYIKGFLEPVADSYPMNEALRASLENRLEEEGLEVILDELRSLNPSGLGELDRNNPRRVVRALERCRVSGKSLVELKEEFNTLPTPFDAYEKQTTLLYRDKTVLEERIRLRAAQMFEAGFWEEVKALQSAGIETNPIARATLGYRECLDYLKEPTTQEALLEVIAVRTRQLAAKQRKWFRTQINWDRVIDLDEMGLNEALENLFDV